MRTPFFHTIQQQHLHIEVNGTEADALALQHSLPDLCRNWLTPAIEQVLDRYAPPEGHLYIESLEIDAGALPIDRIESGLAGVVSEALEKSLGELTPPLESSPEFSSSKVRHKTAHHSVHEALIYFLQNGILPWSFHLPADSTLEQEILNSWRKSADSELNVWRNTDSVLIFASETVRKRLIQQFSPEFLKTLLLMISPEVRKVIDVVFQTIHRETAPSAERENIDAAVWESAFAFISEDKVPSAENFIWNYLTPDSGNTAKHAKLKTLLENHWLVISREIEKAGLMPSSFSVFDKDVINQNGSRSKTDYRISTADKDVKIDEPLPSGRAVTDEENIKNKNNYFDGSKTPTTNKNIEKAESPPSNPFVTDKTGINEPERINENKELYKAVQTDKGGEYASPEPLNRPVFEQKIARENTARNEDAHETPLANVKSECIEQAPPSKLAIEKTRFLFSEHTEAEKGIYIENAGLVILHPFLSRFFEGLNIADNDILVQPERALCLLYFLTTGRKTAPEYELALPKVLCNISPETPVKSDVGLTEDELNEAAALLKAVIQHWEALKNTSPDGLRGAFLLRPGKISMRDEDWLLQVEPRSFDILLNQLPWPISMIKLPWMERMLRVEWR